MFSAFVTLVVGIVVKVFTGVISLALTLVGNYKSEIVLVAIALVTLLFASRFEKFLVCAALVGAFYQGLKFGESPPVA